MVEEVKDLEEVISKDLSVQFSETAVQAMQDQHRGLKTFVQNQMVKDVDYGIIPGTHKPSLYKSGAEKLKKIFQLGSRIVDKSVVNEKVPPFIMYSYTIEVFHIPSGKAISQCEGSANSDERKFKKTQIPDLHNTLMKMAQKRADVGATISAVNASELFTQDVEDLKGTGLIPTVDTNPSEIDFDNYVLMYGRNKGMQIKDVNKNDLDGFISWTKTAKITAPKVLEQRDIIKFYLDHVLLSAQSSEIKPPQFDDSDHGWDKNEPPF